MVNAADGVDFPADASGHRSSLATGRAIFADSIREVDPSIAATIEHTGDWRKGYLTPVKQIVIAAAQTPEAALTISRDGLASAHRRFVYAGPDGDRPIDDVTRAEPEHPLHSVHVRGLAARELDLSLPYRGRRLFGDDLRRQIDEWVDRGIAEPSFAVALHAVLDNPEWLDLRDVDIALLGAGAEMAPTRSLLRWGARVHAVDLPRPEIWQHLIAITRATAGTLRVPIAQKEDGRLPFVTGGVVHPENDADVSRDAGTNLLTQVAEIRAWLAEIEAPFTLGTYIYADGAIHARLSMAADSLATALLAQGKEITLAYLATPTDVFMVPEDVVEWSQRRWAQRGFTGLLQAPMRMAGQFEPNYPEMYHRADGSGFGVCDSLIPQQGPNYLLAKRIQRWRALVAAADGVPVSLNLAPATRTKSVVRNRALAAAYAGANRFGVEVFEPSTSTTLMAALLVHDLRTRSEGTSNPMDMFVQAANHGGLWRAAYAPRSVLGIAAVLGMLNSRA